MIERIVNYLEKAGDKITGEHAGTLPRFIVMLGIFIATFVGLGTVIFIPIANDASLAEISNAKWLAAFSSVIIVLGSLVVAALPNIDKVLRYSTFGEQRLDLKNVDQVDVFFGWVYVSGLALFVPQAFIPLVVFLVSEFFLGTIALVGLGFLAWGGVELSRFVHRFKSEYLNHKRDPNAHSNRTSNTTTQSNEEADDSVRELNDV